MKFMAEANAYKEDMFKYLKAVGFPEPIQKAAIGIADAFDLYNGGYGVLLLVRIAEVIMKATDAGTLDDPYNNPTFIKNKKPKEMTPEIIESIVQTFGKKSWIMSSQKHIRNEAKKILTKHLLLKEPSLFDISESYKNKNPDAVKKMGYQMLGEFPPQVAEAVKALNNKYRFTDYYTAPILPDIANRIIEQTSLGTWKNKDGNYTFIPSKPGFVAIKFGLKRASKDISTIYSKPLFDADSQLHAEKYAKNAANDTMNSWAADIEELLRQHIGKQKLSLFDISEGYVDYLMKDTLNKLKKDTPEYIINIIRDINNKFPFYGSFVVKHTAELIKKAFKDNDTTETLAKLIVNWDIFRPDSDNIPTATAIEKILNSNMKKPSLFDIQESESSDKSFDKASVEELKKAKYPDAVTNAVMDIFKAYPKLTGHNSVYILQDIADLIVMNTGLGNTINLSTKPQFTSKTDVKKDVSPKRLREVAWAIYADYNPAFTDKNGRPKQESFGFIRKTLESNLSKKPSLFDI